MLAGEFLKELAQTKGYDKFGLNEKVSDFRLAQQREQ